ncbi:replication protein [Pantoea eucrina]|uniref:replication protein n=1 Tax=Pantoea eucrina TaxID=472693 RepID=UPI0024B75774|nr:replication protein [Pantoea eucrina]MDJ0023085.1 replication protein [Pantoea eucrina]
MINLAYDNVQPIKPDLKVVEQRVADTDDGFIMLAMKLYEELIGANLTRNQAKVAHAVCRKTYGFKKKMDRIADSQLAELCRISRPKANIAKNELIAMKVLLKEGSKIGPNKNISEWEIPTCSQIDNIVTKSVTENVPKAVSQGVTKTEHTKDIIQNKKEITPISPVGDESIPAEKQKRKTVSKYHFDRDQLKDTWNRKAETYGLPKMVSISATTEKGIKRLYDSHLKHCKETGRPAQQIDRFINGYIEFGYQPTEWACGANPAGKRYGIDTALTQKKIDEIISQEA